MKGGGDGVLYHMLMPPPPQQYVLKNDWAVIGLNGICCILGGMTYSLSFQAATSMVSSVLCLHHAPAGALTKTLSASPLPPVPKQPAADPGSLSDEHFVLHVDGCVHRHHLSHQLPADSDCHVSQALGWTLREMQ